MHSSAKLLLAVSIALSLSSCSPKLTSSFTNRQDPLDAEENVVVVDAQTALPEEAEFLGTAKVGDSGFTTPANGTYDKVLSLVMDEARNAGGNVIRITKEIPSTPSYTTYRLETEIYKLGDLSLLTQEKETKPAVTTSHPDYAIIYLYRTGASLGPLVKYDVYVNDTKVYHCIRNSKAEVKLYEPGRMNVWAKTEAKTEIPLTIDLGEEYYIECNVTTGFFIGRPDFHVTDTRVGANYYNSIESK